VEKQLNTPASRNNNRLVLWLASVLLLIGFGLGDMALIAWYASLATAWQLAASAVSFALIGGGLLVTAWQIH
jgi:hypothetical protein